MINNKIDAGRFWLCECDCSEPFLVVADVVGREIQSMPNKYASVFAESGIEFEDVRIMHLDDSPQAGSICGEPLELPKGSDGANQGM